MFIFNILKGIKLLMEKNTKAESYFFVLRYSLSFFSYLLFFKLYLILLSSIILGIQSSSVFFFIIIFLSLKQSRAFFSEKLTFDFFSKYKKIIFMSLWVIYS